MSNKKNVKILQVFLKNRSVIQNILHVVKDPCSAFLTYYLALNCIVRPLVLCALEIYVRGGTKVLPHFFQTQ